MHKLEQDALKEKLGSLWKGSNKLFTTDDGADMHPDTPTAWFPKFLKTWPTSYEFSRPQTHQRNHPYS